MKEELIKTFDRVSTGYFANSNSLHRLGTESNKLIDASSKQILDVLGLTNKEVIYTTGNVENDNLCILGYLRNFSNPKHILVEKGSSDSIIMCLDKIKNFGFTYDVFDKFSLNLIRDNTVLICFVNEFLEADKIPAKVKTYINLVNIRNSDVNNYTFIGVDMMGICEMPYNGCLIKNKDVNLVPLIHGGKSVTKYRSGTPNAPFSVILSKGIRLKYQKR